MRLLLGFEWYGFRVRQLWFGSECCDCIRSELCCEPKKVAESSLRDFLGSLYGGRVKLTGCATSVQKLWGVLMRR